MSIIAIIITYIVLFIVVTKLDDKIKNLQRRVDDLENEK